MNITVYTPEDLQRLTTDELLKTYAKLQICKHTLDELNEAVVARMNALGLLNPDVPWVEILLSKN
jgi:hypothetical protein